MGIKFGEKERVLMPADIIAKIKLWTGADVDTEKFPSVLRIITPDNRQYTLVNIKKVKAIDEDAVIIQAANWSLHISSSGRMTFYE